MGRVPDGDNNEGDRDGEPDRKAGRYIRRRATIRELHLGPRRYSSEPNIISSGTRSGSRVRETRSSSGLDQRFVRRVKSDLKCWRFVTHSSNNCP